MNCLFIATRAIFQLSGGCHQGCKFSPMLGAQDLWAGRDLYGATPTATRDLGLYSLIRKTGTHVPQWDSNPRCKDHQIIAPKHCATRAARIWIKTVRKKVHFINSSQNEGLSPSCIALFDGFGSISMQSIWFFRLFYNFHICFRISNFFGPSTTEETYLEI
jgi:hypothetical protein